MPEDGSTEEMCVGSSEVAVGFEYRKPKTTAKVTITTVVTL
ncbi:MAG TPA: hypothetical protein VJN71_03300 [Nitrososphaerales archaeon]|nr:hypothetical protein [Nitrososphaerales archaeon]